MHASNVLIPSNEPVALRNAPRSRTRAWNPLRLLADKWFRTQATIDDWLDGPFIARVESWLTHDRNYFATQAAIWGAFFALSWWVGGVLERESWKRYLETFPPAVTRLSIPEQDT